MSALSWVLLIGALLVALAAVTIAFGSLRWWVLPRPMDQRVGPNQLPAPDHARRFVVYVGGIDAYSPWWMSDRETSLLDAVASASSDWVVVRNLFVYDPAVAQLPLTRSGPVWKALHALRSRGGFVEMVSRLTNLRNFLEVCVSADRRYGPIYNADVASRLAEALYSNGYAPERDGSITLLGFSGGAQLALGAAAHLRRQLRVRVSLVALGGFIAAISGFEEVHRLVDIHGRRDLVRKAGVLVCPARWPAAWCSSWNRARRAGEISDVDLGPLSHTGPSGYLTTPRSLNATAQAVVAAIESIHTMPLESLGVVASAVPNG